MQKCKKKISKQKCKKEIFESFSSTLFTIWNFRPCYIHNKLCGLRIAIFINFTKDDWIWIMNLMGWKYYVIKNPMFLQYKNMHEYIYIYNDNFFFHFSWATYTIIFNISKDFGQFLTIDYAEHSVRWSNRNVKWYLILCFNRY